MRPASLLALSAALAVGLTGCTVLNKLFKNEPSSTSSSGVGGSSAGGASSASQEREAELSGRPIANAELAAEAMVTVAFNLGAGSVDLSSREREAVKQRIIIEVRMIMRGAQAQALDEEERRPGEGA